MPKLITRARALAMCGEDAVNKVDEEPCDFTGRLMPQGEDLIEFNASVPCVDNNGIKCHVSAYYYLTQEELDNCGDDLGNADWEIAGYEVV